MFVRQRDQGEEQLEINFLKKKLEIFSSKQSETSQCYFLDGPGSCRPVREEVGGVQEHLLLL